MVARVAAAWVMCNVRRWFTWLRARQKYTPRPFEAIYELLR